MTELEARQIELARHYASIGRPERALAALDRSGAVGSAEAWAIRGEALYHLDRYDEGANAARRGLEADPDDIELLDVLALNLMEQDQLVEAERALLRALELWPEHPVLLSHYALACAKDGQYEKATKLLDRAARLEPESADVVRTRAQVAYLCGRRREAMQYADELLRLEPEDRIGHVIRGNVLVDSDDVYKAVRHFEEAARLDPTDREIAHVARHNRVVTHWLQWPLYPIQRFGPLKVWAAYLVLLGVILATDQWWLAAIVVPLYLFLVVYSWTVAPLARWWMHRRNR